MAFPSKSHDEATGLQLEGQTGGEPILTAITNENPNLLNPQLSISEVWYNIGLPYFHIAVTDPPFN